jgi:hypothetical protein
MVALFSIATALNLAILIFNLSLPSRAAVAGMDTKALIGDSDFKAAVQSVIQGCRVNVDLGKIRC